MSGFSAEWLALREPYDRAARNRGVLDAVGHHFADQAAIAVVDLACGTGSTVRAIGAHLPPRQSWRLVDNDLSLLARASELGRPPQVTVGARPVDLARDLELALDGPADLITASALLDLVSADWLDRLVVEAAARQLPVYAALSYDGRAVFEPAVPCDAELVAGFNAHQRTDKGFGPALGPAAPTRAAERFAGVGYSVVQGRSDWMLGPGEPRIQAELLASFAEVGAGTTQMNDRELAQWLSRRRAHLEHGQSLLTIGHVDIFAFPA
jgi:hypothetical protein